MGQKLFAYVVWLRQNTTPFQYYKINTPRKRLVQKIQSYAWPKGSLIFWRKVYVYTCPIECAAGLGSCVVFPGSSQFDLEYHQAILYNASLEDKPRLGARPRLTIRAFCWSPSLNPILDSLLRDPLSIPYKQLDEVTPTVHKALVYNFHKSRLYSIHQLWGR